MTTWLSLGSNAEAATLWLVKGEPAQDNGFLVSETKLKWCIDTALNYRSLTRQYELDVDYLKTQLKDTQSKCDLEMTAEKGKNDVIIKKLEDELRDTKVWYKQPKYVALGTFVLTVFGFSYFTH